MPCALAVDGLAAAGELAAGRALLLLSVLLAALALAAAPLLVLAALLLAADGAGATSVSKLLVRTFSSQPRLLLCHPGRPAPTSGTPAS